MGSQCLQRLDEARLPRKDAGTWAFLVPVSARVRHSPECVVIEVGAAGMRLVYCTFGAECNALHRTLRRFGAIRNREHRVSRLAKSRSYGAMAFSRPPEKARSCILLELSSLGSASRGSRLSIVTCGTSCLASYVEGVQERRS
jgi:hypothetical protein